MNIFENYRASKIYTDLVRDLGTTNNEQLVDEFRDRVKKAFHNKVVSDVELEHYKLTGDDVQSIFDALWAEVNTN